MRAPGKAQQTAYERAYEQSNQQCTGGQHRYRQLGGGKAKENKTNRLLVLKDKHQRYGYYNQHYGQ
ncbi:hypothetical protein [Pseudomonas putida]